MISILLSSSTLNIFISLADKPNILTNVSWLKSPKQANYVFSPGPIDVNASAETLWKVALQTDAYYQRSNGAMTAKVVGELKPGNTISLKLYKDKLIGMLIPKVNGTITIVDENLKIIGWSLKLPFNAGYTQRYQFIEPITKDTSRSYIADHIPGKIGFFCDLLMKKVINSAFKSLNQGLKEEAERIETSFYILKD